MAARDAHLVRRLAEIGGEWRLEGAKVAGAELPRRLELHGGAGGGRCGGGEGGTVVDKTYRTALQLAAALHDIATVRVLLALPLRRGGRRARGGECRAARLARDSIYWIGLHRELPRAVPCLSVPLQLHTQSWSW